MEKFGSFVQSPCSLPHLGSLNCLKKCIFCTFVMTSPSNLHIGIWKFSLRTFRKWCCLSYDLLFRRYLGLKLKSFVNFLLCSIFFDILITNMSWMVPQTPINHIFFWKSVMRAFIWIHVHCFNKVTFIGEISTRLQKIQSFGQFKDHNLRRRH